jgi:hypothetical protein
MSTRPNFLLAPRTAHCCLLTHGLRSAYGPVIAACRPYSADRQSLQRVEFTRWDSRPWMSEMWSIRCRALATPPDILSARMVRVISELSRKNRSSRSAIDRNPGAKVSFVVPIGTSPPGVGVSPLGGFETLELRARAVSPRSDARRHEATCRVSCRRAC